MGASLDYEFKVERDDQPVNGFVDEQMLVSFEQTLNKDGQGMAVKNFMFKEVQIIGEGLNLTSGFLEETDIQLKVKKKTGLPPMQKRTSDALKIVAMKKDSASPQSVYLKPKDLEGYIENLSGNYIKAGTIIKHLEALKDKNKVVYDPDWGYQHEDFKDMPPNFPQKKDD